jgi:hypothetical protein
LARSIGSFSPDLLRKYLARREVFPADHKGREIPNIGIELLFKNSVVGFIAFADPLINILGY